MLPQVVTKSAGHCIVGGVVSVFQTYVTVLVALLRQPSVPITVKVRVLVQPEVESTWLMFVLSTLQLSVTVTRPARVVSSGGLATLQPRSRPDVGTVTTGGVVST